MWEILGIEETKDEKRIKEAYLEKVKDVNPEDKPEEFKQLREAYEQAMAYAKEEDNTLQSDPVTTGCLNAFDEIYRDMRKRCDINEWKKLLSLDFFTDLNTCEQAQDTLITYINEHWRLPKEIVAYLCEALEIKENYEHYCEVIDEENVEWLLYDASNIERGLPPQLFVPGINGDVCDEYDMLFSRINNENEKQTLQRMSELGESHPYAQMQILVHRDYEGEDVENEMGELLKQYPNDWTIFGNYIQHFSRETQASEINEALRNVEDRFDDIGEYHLIKAITANTEGRTLEALKEANEATILSKTGTNIRNKGEELYDIIGKQIVSYYQENGIDGLENEELYEIAFAAMNNDERAFSVYLYNRINKEQLSEYKRLTLEGAYLYTIEMNHQGALKKYEEIYDLLKNKKPDTKENRRILRRKDKIIQTIYMDKANEGIISHEEAFQKVIEEGDDCFNIFLYATIHYCNKKEFDKALDMANRAICLSPYNPVALFNKAFTLFNFNEAYKALQNVNKAISFNAQNYPAYLLKALIFAVYGEYDQSMETIDELTKMISQPSLIGNYCIALKKLWNDDDAAAAKKILDEIVENIDNLEIPLQNARILYSSAQADQKVLDMNEDKNIEHILEKAEAVLKADDTHLGAKAMKANSLKKLRRYDEMLDVLYDMKKDPNHNNWVEDQIGYQYNKTLGKDPQRVIDIFKESYNMSPCETQPWYIGNAYFVMNRFEDALAMFDLETEHEPDDFDGYNGKAEVYMMMREYDKALNEINKSIELVKDLKEKNYSSIYRIKYRILARAKRTQEAVDFINEARNYDNFNDWLTYLMHAYDRNNQHQEGIEIVKDIYNKSKGKDETAAYILLVNALSENDLHTAKKIVAAARKNIRESSVEYWQYLIDEFEQKYNDIITYQLKCLKNMDENSDDCSMKYGVIAEYYYLSGRNTEAQYYANKVIGLCDRYLREYSLDKPLYLTRKSRALMILGKEDEARELLSQARALPLCKFCDHHFCKDALLFEAFIEEMRKDYEKAIKLNQQGIDENCGESDFAMMINRIRKKMKTK